MFLIEISSALCNQVTTLRTQSAPVPKVAVVEREKEVHSYWICGRECRHWGMQKWYIRDHTSYHIHLQHKNSVHRVPDYHLSVNHRQKHTKPPPPRSKHSEGPVTGTCPAPKMGYYRKGVLIVPHFLLKIIFGPVLRIKIMLPLLFCTLFGPQSDYLTS